MGDPNCEHEKFKHCLNRKTRIIMKLKDLIPFSCKVPSSTMMVSRGRKELHTLYAVKEEIGRGGFGVVYAAERKSDGVGGAIKEGSKDIDMLTEDNFPLEVALMKQVNDIPGVIKLLDYFDTPDSFYVVMERFNSKDLFDFITEQGPQGVIFFVTSCGYAFFMKYFL